MYIKIKNDSTLGWTVRPEVTNYTWMDTLALQETVWALSTIRIIFSQHMTEIMTRMTTTVHKSSKEDGGLESMYVYVRFEFIKYKNRN